MKTATFTLLVACATATTATIPASASVDAPAPTKLRPVPIEIAPAPAPALVPVERVAQNHPEVERLIERLKSQSDDGTLNAQDHLRIRILRKRLAS